MAAEQSLIIQLISVLVLLAVFGYAGLSLLRMRRTAAYEGEVNALRLKAFEEQARYLGARATQAEAKQNNAWSGTRKFRLDQIVPEAADICSFYLAPHDGKPLPAFDPGQYLTFRLQIPGQSKPVVRCYSLSDTPLERDRYRVTIKHLAPPPKEPDAPPGVSSSYFHTALSEGDILDCRAPGGNFFLDMAEHGPIVLIGGGIGITPMISMARSVALSGSQRETWLFYGVRDKRELVLPEQLRELADTHENINVRFCFSNPREGEDVAGKDFDHVGRVSVDLMHRVLPSTNYDYYICGPGPMMTGITADLEAAGVPAARVHYESFGPASVKPKKAPAPEAGASQETFKIEFAKSGKTLDWQADQGSILDFAEANDIELECGCRAGSCGTCTIAVRSGEVGYIDEISAEPEEGSCLACMAVPKQDIVIDA